MPNRHTDRERWEVLIMTILLAFRPLIFIGGCLFLVLAGVTGITYPVMAVISLGLAVFLFWMVLSDQASLFVARSAAYFLTLYSED